MEPLSDERLTELMELRERCRQQFQALDVLMRHVRIPMQFISKSEQERWWQAWQVGWDAIGMVPPIRPSDGVNGIEMVQSRDIAWERAEKAEVEVDRLRARVTELERVLREVEWVDQSYSYPSDVLEVCLICDATFRERDTEHTHAPGCALDAALRRGE